MKLLTTTIIFLSLGLGLVVVSAPSPLLAQTEPKKEIEGPTKVQCPTHDPKKPGRVECLPLDNPLSGDTTDISIILGRILRAGLSIVGSLTLLMMVWGGFIWLTSRGNPEKVKKGTQTMVWAAIGIFLVFASYLILITYVDFLTGVK